MGGQRQDARVSQQFDRYHRYWRQTGDPGTTYPGPRFENNREAMIGQGRTCWTEKTELIMAISTVKSPTQYRVMDVTLQALEEKAENGPHQWIQILRKKSIGGQVGAIHVPVESLGQALEDIRMRTGLQWPGDAEIVLTAVMRGTRGGQGRPAIGGHTPHGAGPLQKTVRMDLVNAGVNKGAHLSPNSQHLMENQRSGRVSSANFDREQNPVHGVRKKNWIV